MQDVISFRMKGEPIPYSLKAKCIKCKKALHYWNENAQYKAHLKACLTASFKGEPMQGPIEMVTEIYFPAGKDPTKKPDADNMEKTIADACEGVIFANDCQIVNNLIYKREGVLDDYEIVIKIRPLKALEYRLKPILEGLEYEKV